MSYSVTATTGYSKVHKPLNRKVIIVVVGIMAYTVVLLQTTSVIKELCECKS